MSTDSEKHVDGQSKLERALAAMQAGDLESARRQLLGLSDDMATKVNIQYYADAGDALLKAT
jgi:hypothetical protein